MQFTKHLQYLFLMIGLVVAISACDNDDEPTADPLSATSLAPNQGPIGSTVVITGTGFNATPTSNTVVFGGNVAAQVTGASATQLTVTVPAGTQNGAISITSGGATAQGPTFTLANRPVVELQGSIPESRTLAASNIYLLRGFVTVTNNAVLTIEPGTIIKGAPATQDPAGANRGGTLIIERGSRIEARGTAQAPIVFTSANAAGSRKYGDWGGLVLIGRAQTNQSSARRFEGGLSGYTFSNDQQNNDNSGTLQYVRIEFAGIALTSERNSEINALTFYQVGSGTTVDHVQVSFSGDDAFEWFGGTVNAKYLVAHRTLDDDFDTDYGYTGKAQFGIALRDSTVSDQSGSEPFESDNFDPGVPATAPNAGLPLTAPVFANFSAFAFRGTPSGANTPNGNGGPFRAAMHLRRNTSISIYNSLFVGFPQGLRLEGTAAGTLANTANGGLELQGIVLANSEVPGSILAVQGVGEITNDLAQQYFNLQTRKNQIIPSSGLATLLLNPQNFNYTAPNFLPQSGSPLLNASAAATGGKIADQFFTPAPYIGAFNTENWTAGWTNFDPQQTNYDL